MKSVLQEGVCRLRIWETAFELGPQDDQNLQSRSRSGGRGGAAAAPGDLGDG